VIQERLKHCKFALLACTNNVKLFCDTCDGGDNYECYEPELERREKLKKEQKQQQKQNGGIHGRNNSDH
jgi:hypothetical protein